MCCWKSEGRDREQVLASLSSVGSSGGPLPAPQRGWLGSRRLSGVSTFLGLSAGGQSRRSWVSSASSESSFRNRFIWGPREEVTPTVAVPAEGGITQCGITSPPQATAARHMHPKDDRDGRRGGTRPPQGPATTLGTATGTALGTAMVPCTPSAYSLQGRDGSQLLALWGTGTFALSTLRLLGVFWGSQDPPTPRDLPGGRGGGRCREAMSSSGGGAGSGASPPGWRQMVGRGLPVPPRLPACRVSAWAMAQGAPVPTVPGDPTRGRHQPRVRRGLGATQPGGCDPHGHAQVTSPRASGPCHPLAHPGAGAGRGLGRSSPRAGGPVGWRGWDEDAGTGTAPHPVDKHRREETSSQGQVRQRVLGDQGSRVPSAPPRQLPGDPRPAGGETPKCGAHRAWGSRRPCMLTPGGQCPPGSGPPGESPPWGDTDVSPPVPWPRSVPAARRDAPNRRAGNKVTALRGLRARLPAPRSPLLSWPPAWGAALPGWGGSGCPHGGVSGPPRSPLPQRVDGTRRGSVTAASSSSLTLTWGGSAAAPHRSTARPGAAQRCETMPPPPPRLPLHPFGGPHRPPPQRSRWPLVMLRHRVGVPQQVRPPQPGCPRDRASPPHSTGVLRVPPSPSAHSLAPPGRDAAPVPLAQAAARGRWPWRSRCHRGRGPERMASERHRLRRGLGSSISITPPWAGTLAWAPTAPSSQAQPLRVLGGRTGGGAQEGHGREPNPAPVRLSRRGGPAKHHWPRRGQGRSWGAA